MRALLAVLAVCLPSPKHFRTCVLWQVPGGQRLRGGVQVAGREALALVLPRVRNTGWFFDTEMLLLAHAAQMRVQEVGVVWIDDRDSRVKVLATIAEMLRGLARLRVGGVASCPLPCPLLCTVCPGRYA